MAERRCRGVYLHSQASVRVLICFQGKAHDGIPAGMIDVVWHASLQGKDAKGWEPSAQMEGGWNATFAILVSRHDVRCSPGQCADCCG